jgi:hypothetical protein
MLAAALRNLLWVWVVATAALAALCTIQSYRLHQYQTVLDRAYLAVSGAQVLLEECARRSPGSPDPTRAFLSLPLREWR